MNNVDNIEPIDHDFELGKDSLPLEELKEGELEYSLLKINSGSAYRRGIKFSSSSSPDPDHIQLKLNKQQINFPKNSDSEASKGLAELCSEWLTDLNQDLEGDQRYNLTAAILQAYSSGSSGERPEIYCMHVTAQSSCNTTEINEEIIYSTAQEHDEITEEIALKLRTDRVSYASVRDYNKLHAEVKDYQNGLQEKLNLFESLKLELAEQVSGLPFDLSFDLSLDALQTYAKAEGNELYVGEDVYVGADVTSSPPPEFTRNISLNTFSKDFNLSYSALIEHYDWLKELVRILDDAELILRESLKYKSIIRSNLESDSNFSQVFKLTVEKGSLKKNVEALESRNLELQNQVIGLEEKVAESARLNDVLETEKQGLQKQSDDYRTEAGMLEVSRLYYAAKSAGLVANLGQYGIILLDVARLLKNAREVKPWLGSARFEMDMHSYETLVAALDQVSQDLFKKASTDMPKIVDGLKKIGGVSGLIQANDSMTELQEKLRTMRNE